MTLTFPEYAIHCIQEIESMGFEAYLVGGCVRDAILGRKINDIDITTNALPNQIIEIFDKTIPTGIQHGTVTVILDDSPIEVTTYRTESGYHDSRHPDSVSFVSSLEMDLGRRDFTVNAMAYNPSTGLVDLFGGCDDLNSGVIRTVGHPKTRFTEDALRILRAFRFASVLDFEIEENTLLAATALKKGINNISGERVLNELIKLAFGKRPSILVDFINAGGLEGFGIGKALYSPTIFDSLPKTQINDNNIVAVFLSLIDCDLEIMAERLRPSNTLNKQLIFLSNASNETATINSKIELKLALKDFGGENILLYIDRLKLLDKAKANIIELLYNDVLQSKEPYRLNDLKVNGQDIKTLGFSGTEIGIVLEKLLNHVIEYPEDNIKCKLLNIAKN